MKPMIFGVGESAPGVADNGRFAGAAKLAKHVFQNVGWRMTRVDEEFGNPFVGIVEQQDTTRGSAVAARSTDFLVISFDGVRNVGVNDKSHLTAVDAHTECICCHD